MKCRKRLIETITNPYHDGIFKELFNLEQFEWLTEDNVNEINIEYYYHHSGDKYISKMYERTELINLRVLAGNKFVLVNNFYVSVNPENSLVNLAKIIYNKFHDKWNRIWNLLVEEHYNPIHNYNMTELETRALANSNTRKQKTNITTSSGNSEYTYGYNETNETPTGKTSSSITSTGDLDDNQIQDSGTDTGTIAHTKSGNIGVTTTQKMLVDEMNVRDRFNFFNIIYKDVDSILCLSVY